LTRKVPGCKKDGVIDFHTHIFSPYARDHREELAERDRTFGSIYADPKARMAGVEELIGMMDEEGLERAVVCGFPWEEVEDCRRENDYLLESAARYPQRLIPFVTFPFSPEGLRELERCLRGGARGAGELAPGTYGQEPLPSDLLREVFQAIREAGIVALVHVNEPVGHPYPGKGGLGLKEVERLVEAAQGVKLVLGHLGGGLLFYELMPEVAALCKDVCYDTAALPLLYDHRVWRVAQEVAGEKLLFGSDFPLLGPRRYLKGMEEAGLDRLQMEAILEGNATRLLGC